MYHIYPYIKNNPTMYSPNPYRERQAESLESLFEAAFCFRWFMEKCYGGTKKNGGITE